MSILPHNCLSRYQTCVVSHPCVPKWRDKTEGDRFQLIMKHLKRHHVYHPSTFSVSHSEHSDLLLSLCSGLLQLGLGLLQLVLHSTASCLQAADLGFALLQRQGQLRHLTLYLQLLLLVLQPDLRGQTERRPFRIREQEERIHPKEQEERHVDLTVSDSTLIHCAAFSVIEF